MICAVVTADSNWGIGKSGRRHAAIPDDEKFISSVAIGQNVIMGRKNYESIPARWHMKRSRMIVVSRREELELPDAQVVHSPLEALEAARNNGGDTYIIGGEKIFKELLDYCDEVRVTHIDYSYDSDAYFPDLDKKVEWVLVDESEEQTHFDIVYFFRRYQRRKSFIG